MDREPWDPDNRYTGRWWLPGDSGDGRTGYLEGFKLSVMDKDRWQHDGAKPIYGQVADGTLLTLYNAVDGGWAWSPGLHHSYFHAESVIWGSHYEGHVPSSASFVFEGLLEWTAGHLDSPDNDSQHSAVVPSPDYRSPGTVFTWPEQWHSAPVAARGKSVRIAHGWSGGLAAGRFFRAEAGAAFEVEDLTMEDIRWWSDGLYGFVAFWALGPVAVVHTKMGDSSVHWQPRVWDRQFPVAVHELLATRQTLNELGHEAHDLLDRWLTLYEQESTFGEAVRHLTDSAKWNWRIDRSLHSAFRSVEALVGTQKGAKRKRAIKALCEETGTDYERFQGRHGPLDLRDRAVHLKDSGIGVDTWMRGVLLIQRLACRGILHLLGFDRAEVKSIESDCYRFRQYEPFLRSHD